MKILVLDNYDSFTYNLVHYIEKVKDVKADVFRNDQISLEQVNAYDKILLSPGPGVPSEAGILNTLIHTYASSKSILGVCLGQQAIAEVFGGSILNLEKVYHGVATPVFIKKPDPIFSNIPENFLAGRYHSWAVNKNLPSSLEVLAVDEDGNIMALRHKIYDVKGVQFHPESILTEFGEQLISNWLNL